MATCCLRRNLRVIGACCLSIICNRAWLQTGQVLPWRLAKHTMSASTRRLTECTDGLAMLRTRKDLGTAPILRAAAAKFEGATSFFVSCPFHLCHGLRHRLAC